MRRGLNKRHYATGVHQDFPGTAKEYAEFIESYQSNGKGADWLKFFEGKEDCFGMTIVCFWRPIHMKNPLVNKPLGMLSA